MQKISFVFFGTDDFSVAVLDELKRAELMPSLIVTAPDRPKGRGMKISASAVTMWAKENAISYLQPTTLDDSVRSKLRAESCQLFVVASYGLIIPPEIVHSPERGVLNVHPSLLPKYRGATPIEHQILHEERNIGVSIILLDEQMDHGPLIAQRRIDCSAAVIHHVPKASELRKRLAVEGGRLLSEVIPKWVAGIMKPSPQDDSMATYTKKLSKSDGELDLADEPRKNFLKVRAFEDSIGSYFFALKGTRRIRVIIKDAEWGDGALRINRVVPEGKREMSYEESLRGGVVPRKTSF